MAVEPGPVTASDVLRRAAEKLDQLATAATSGPWRTADVEGILYVASARSGPVTMGIDAPVCGCLPDCDTGGVAMERDESEGGRADADWMAALGPQVAAPLAAWLRTTAADHDRRELLFLVGGGAPAEAALAFAYAVLGESS